MNRASEYTIVQIVHIDDTGDSCYRMRWPARALAEQAPNWRVLNVSADCQHRFDWALNADLLVLFQSHDADFYAIISERKKRGLKTLVEYNDNFYHPQPWSPIADAWQSRAIWAAYEKFMHLADGVIVTGPGLRNLFPEVTKTPIHILENHLPETPSLFPELQRKKTPYPSFGWAGSLGHMGDLLAFVPVAKQILRAVPGSRFHIMGNESIPALLDISPDRLVYTPWGKMQEYYAFWEKIQVGVAPLLPTPYNECRSDIKAVEIASCGAAPVLTKALPYERFAEVTNTQLFERFLEIGDRIIHLLKDSKELQDWASRSHEYVCNERVQLGRTERLQLYTQFLPENSSQALWSHPLGYHEVTEPKQNFPKIQGIIENIKKQPSEADRLITRFVADHPENPDGYLLLARLCTKTSPDRAHQILNESKQKFPDDMRFLIRELAIARSPSEVRQIWKDITALLENEKPDYITTVEKELAVTLVTLLDRLPECTDLAEKLLTFAPYLYSLRTKLASIYERTEQYQLSLAHYEIVLRAFREFKRGGEELANLDRGYLEAWVAALSSRIAHGYGK